MKRRLLWFEEHLKRNFGCTGPGDNTGLGNNTGLGDKTGPSNNTGLGGKTGLGHKTVLGDNTGVDNKTDLTRSHQRSSCAIELMAYCERENRRLEERVIQMMKIEIKAELNLMHSSAPPWT
ncbi:hypothetical protein PSHT_08829 [Puccinia striiformis]|uniref:Uncharacterized protein n=1 Tax=Puccinia striiformis TaxID=27350 RepID=A0A2S4VLF0_9BASI|nr:hypothetical protein PSHT_08829 [Puccinia striiformis]